MAAPEWAKSLLERVCSDYGRALPGTFYWRQTSYTDPWHKHSSGRTMYTHNTRGYRILKRQRVGSTMKFVKFKGRIAVTAGWDEADQRLVLLHEIAHWLRTRNKGHGHDAKFWNLAFELYDRYGVDHQYALEREGNYREGAKLAYARRTK